MDDLMDNHNKTKSNRKLNVKKHQLAQTRETQSKESSKAASLTYFSEIQIDKTVDRLFDDAVRKQKKAQLRIIEQSKNEIEKT